MSDFVRNIIRFALFILVQVYVLNKIPHLHRFIIPYIYFLFLTLAAFQHIPHWLADHWFHPGYGIGLFYNDTWSSCRRLYIGGLCPSVCNQYSYTQRIFRVQLSRTLSKIHGMDALPGVHFCFNLTASRLFNFIGVAFVSEVFFSS